MWPRSVSLWVPAMEEEPQVLCQVKAGSSGQSCTDEPYGSTARPEKDGPWGEIPNVTKMSQMIKMCQCLPVSSSSAVVHIQWKAQTPEEQAVLAGDVFAAGPSPHAEARRVSLHSYTYFVIYHRMGTKFWPGSLALFPDCLKHHFALFLERQPLELAQGREIGNTTHKNTNVSNARPKQRREARGSLTHFSPLPRGKTI